jgi:hypothetical protein
VPTLRNPRHERFARELAAGKTADAAYVLAGYGENRNNAARLNASQDIQKRVVEIQSVGAERAAVTVETLIAEAEEARSKAMGDKGGAAAAVAAIIVKAKLAGLWRDKVAVTDPSGDAQNEILERGLLRMDPERHTCTWKNAPVAASAALFYFYYLSNELSIVACSLAVKPLHFTKSSFGRNDLASPRALRRTDDFPKTRI